MWGRWTARPLLAARGIAQRILNGMDLSQQKQQLSFAYARAVAAAAGYAVSEPSVDDDSVDMTFLAGSGFQKRPRVEAQLKCSSDDTLGTESFAFPLSMKNYDDLRADTQVPRILVVLRVPPDPAAWLNLNEERLLMRHCGYWHSLAGAPESENTTSVSVTISRGDLFDADGLTAMMSLIQAGGRP